MRFLNWILLNFLDFLLSVAESYHLVSLKLWVYCFIYNLSILLLKLSCFLGELSALPFFSIGCWLMLMLLFFFLDIYFLSFLLKEELSLSYQSSSLGNNLKNFFKCFLGFLIILTFYDWYWAGPETIFFVHSAVVSKWSKEALSLAVALWKITFVLSLVAVLKALKNLFFN